MGSAVMQQLLNTCGRLRSPATAGVTNSSSENLQQKPDKWIHVCVSSATCALPALTSPPFLFTLSSSCFSFYLLTSFLFALVPAVIRFQRRYGGNQIKKSEAKIIIPVSSACSSHQKAQAMFQLEEVKQRAQHPCTDPPRISGMQG